MEVQIMGYTSKSLERENRELKEHNRQLKNLCKEKDGFFIELMSDALRHGSSVAAKHMADRKKHLHSK